MSTSSTFSYNPLGYEGIDLNSVASVLTPALRIPTTNDVQPYGTIWPYISTSPATLYISQGAGNWGTFVLASGDVATISSDAGTASPASNNITITGGTTGLTTSASGHTITLTGTLGVGNGGIGSSTLTNHSVLLGAGASPINNVAVGATGTVLMGSTGADPFFSASPTFGGTVTAGTGLVTSAGNITASAGSVTAATTLTATLGAITATNGNLVLGSAGNKLVIHATTAASDSVGTTGVMSGTPGAVTITSSAITASSVILYSRATTGGTPGMLSITAKSAGSATLTSTSNETSTFYYVIIN